MSTHITLTDRFPNRRAFQRIADASHGQIGSIVGNKRTFVKDLDSGVEGKHVKLTYIEVEVSPISYTYQAEASIDGGLSTVIAQGKVTKVR